MLVHWWYVSQGVLTITPVWELPSLLGGLLHKASLVNSSKVVCNQYWSFSFGQV